MPYGSISVDKIENSDGFTLGGSGAAMKNRIINGAMVIDQRNAGASVSVDGTAPYTLDRWQAVDSSDGVFSVQQDSSANTVAGFTSSLKVTTTTADSSLSASQFANLLYKIEGNNVSDLGWGTANAKTVTLSFWVRSSLTGTFAGSIRNDAGARSYVFNYTISSANTWEYKTITIAGDTSGTWETGISTGLLLTWSLGAGSNFDATAGSWGAGSYFNSSGAVSVIGTLNATFYITGVQLEVGSTATSFDYRPYGTELALCQRYYYKTFPAAGTKILTTGGNCEGTTTAYGAVSFPVTMRTAPSALEQSGTASDYVVFHSATSTTCSAVPTFNSATTQNIGSTNATVASGLTANRPANLGTNSANGYLAWSAEL
jgi:hypothetical protein